MKKVRVPRPLRTQCHFLETTPQLPQQIIQHLQNRTPNKGPTAAEEESHIPRTTHTPTKTTKMDMGPDLYDTDSSGPQRAGTSSSGKSDSSSRSRDRTPLPPPNVISCGARCIRTTTAPAIVTPNSSYSQNSSRLWYQFAQASGDPDYAHARPCWKARLAICKLCKRHEICYSSAYTRPSEELLREILEVRYPVPDDEEDEEAPLVRKKPRRTC